MRRKYDSLTLEEQDIIKKIHDFQSHSGLKYFIKSESINLSESAADYARLRYLELKRQEWREYYNKHKQDKLSNNKYLRYISLCKTKEGLEKYLDKDLNDNERTYLNNRLEEFKPKPKIKKEIKIKETKTNQYKYVDIIEKCNNTTTLRTYKTFTDLTKYELDLINKKIKQINHDTHKENLEKSYIQLEVEQQLEYQRDKDIMMKEWLAKGNKPKVYDFGL